MSRPLFVVCLVLALGAVAASVFGVRSAVAHLTGLGHPSAGLHLRVPGPVRTNAPLAVVAGR